MDINAMFGMEYNPFRKTRNMKHIETSEFREVQARLRYLQENHGFGLISGESGRGKTTAVREWARSLNPARSEEHTSELQSRFDLVCRLLLEKKKRSRPSLSHG